ncbi:MAG TPA: DUF2339 domain-containing protein [Candidatus Paceibacterota bacterium]
MFLFDLIVLFVFAIIILNQGTRISRLEKAVRENKIAPQAASQKASTSAPAVPVAAPVAAAQAPASRPASVSAPASAPVSAQREDHVAEAVSSGRTLAILGIAAVFIGMAFFLKYAFDNNWISPAGRVILGIIAGIAMMGVGQSLRKKYLEYSDFLIGGGLALLYLSVFSAHFFFHLIAPFTAWFFMAIITFIGLVISFVNATRVLAVVSIIGGFLVPFMASSGGNDMLALFGYLSILNIGVLALSFNKDWKELGFAAFIGTFVNFSAWYGSYYSPMFMGEALSFCFLVFLVFLGTTVVRCAHQKVSADPVDYFTLAGSALFITFFGYTMLESAGSSMLGAGSLLIAVIYFFAALWINAANREDKTLNIFLPGLSVTFLSLFIPLQFDGSWIAVGWLVEALSLYAIACFMGNRGFQVMGATVYILGIISMFATADYYGYGQPFMPVFNNDFIVAVLAIVIAYAIAFIYKKYGSVTEETQARGISLYVVAANILTVYAVSTQIWYYSRSLGTIGAENYGNTLVSLFWAAYAALLTAIGFVQKISGIRRLGLILFIITAFKVLMDVWSLGQIYRIVSLIVFGIIALCASFAYAKYKDRLKDVI